MSQLIQRKFESPGDVEQAARLVEGAQGTQQTRELAKAHAERAMSALMKVRCDAS